MYTHHEHTTYNQSYPYKNVRICEECHNIIIQREKEAQS
jgi:hypothetical protein